MKRDRIIVLICSAIIIGCVIITVGQCQWYHAAEQEYQSMQEQLSEKIIKKEESTEEDDNVASGVEDNISDDTEQILERVERPERYEGVTYADIPEEVTSDKRFQYVLDSRYWSEDYTSVDVTTDSDYISVVIYYNDYKICIFDDLYENKMYGYVRTLDDDDIDAHLIPEGSE